MDAAEEGKAFCDGVVGEVFEEFGITAADEGSEELRVFAEVVITKALLALAHPVH